jgi:hypothetical protein
LLFIGDKYGYIRFLKNENRKYFHQILYHFYRHLLLLGSLNYIEFITAKNPQGGEVGKSKCLEAK